MVNEKVGTEEAVEIVKLTIKEAKLLNVKEVIIRNPFRVFHKDLCDETDYAIWYHGFFVKERELEIAVSLKGNIDEIRKRYENGTKYNVKKAVKGSVNEVANGVADFYDITT